MEKATVCTINLAGEYIAACKAAVSITRTLPYTLQSEFGSKISKVTLDDAQLLIKFLLRLDNAIDEAPFDFTGEELVLLYTCHYIANCFTQQKELFFKWFLQHEDGTVGNSHNFRISLQNVQFAGALVIYNSGVCESEIDSRKQQLLQLFGPCYDSDGLEAYD
jgi:hypothetical protein